MDLQCGYNHAFSQTKYIYLFVCVICNFLLQILFKSIPNNFGVHSIPCFWPYFPIFFGCSSLTPTLMIHIMQDYLDIKSILIRLKYMCVIWEENSHLMRSARYNFHFFVFLAFWGCVRQQFWFNNLPNSVLTTQTTTPVDLLSYMKGIWAFEF